MTLDFRGARKGLRIQGDSRLVREAGVVRRMRTHWADINGRMYLCNCAAGFRVGPAIHYGGRRAPKRLLKGSRHFFGR